MKHVILSILITMGCGRYSETNCAVGSSNASSNASSTESKCPTNAAPSTPSSTQGLSDTDASLSLSGYVASAFTMTVDGRQYKDSEDYYTTTMDGLEAEATKAGYQGYEVTFDAQIGLDDLKYGMDVYIQAQGNTGYAGDTQVDQDGKFRVQFPGPAASNTFDVRANKRINVKLTSPDQQIQVSWCYNFSGVQQGVKISTTSQPIILHQFSSSLTKYKCAVTSGGVQIPIAPKTGTTTPVTATTDTTTGTTSGTTSGTTNATGTTGTTNATGTTGTTSGTTNATGTTSGTNATGSSGTSTHATGAKG